MILNSAVAGDTAADLRRRLQADVIERRPDLLIVCVGTNDAAAKRKVGDFRADLRFVVDTVLKSGARVMLMTPSPFGDPERERRFQDYLAAIRGLAAERNLVVADAHAVFVDWAKQGREMLGPDGVHHGRDGFEGTARAVLDALGLEAAAMDTKVRPWPGLLLEWETSEPMPRDGKYDPSEAAGWRPYDAKSLAAGQPWWNSPFPARGAWMPFADADPKRVAYGRTRYTAAAAGAHELRVGGSPAPQIVWVNNRKVWPGARHGYHPDADRLVVDLKAGTNEIIVVSNFMLFLGISRLP